MSQSGNTSYTLLHRALNLNDEEAWVELSKHYYQFICYVLHQIKVNENDIEDIAQQVMMTLTQKLKTFDKEKGKFKSWLSTVIKNAAYMHFRKQSRSLQKAQSSEAAVELAVPYQESELEVIIETEWKKYVSNIAFDRVKQSFRGQAINVFELSITGKSNKEISEETGLALSSVTTLKKRVKRSLLAEVRAVVNDLEQH